MKNFKKTVYTSLLAGAVIFGTAACAPTINMRGNMVQDYQIAEVQTGTDTRSDILKKLGSPTTKAPFNDNIWYYMGQETAKRGILDPEVTEERIIEVTFNDQGTVQNIQHIKNHRQDIPINRDKTPTSGNEITALQQFVGNLGRFNPPTDGGGDN